jgi:multisubunit Na+/H+ antiporter MnhG subunit
VHSFSWAIWEAGSTGPLLAMMDRIVRTPEAFVSAILVWVPVAIWIISLVNWMITSEIDAISGIFGITLAVAVGFLAVNPPHPSLAPVFVLVAFVTVVVAPVTRAAMNRAALQSIEVEAIERAYEMLSTKPDNFGAKIRLARALWAKGIRSHAVAIADGALKNAPEQMFAEEHRMLRQWRAAEEGDPGVHRIRCVECGVPNTPGGMFCTRCGAPFLLDYAQGKFVKTGVIRRVTAGWIAAVAALVAIPTVAVKLPPVASVIAIPIIVFAGGWLLYSAFREPSPGRR